MLKIYKNRILYFEDNNSSKFQNLTKIKGGLFKKMNDTVEIAENVTFDDFFKFLIKEKELVEIIFQSSLYGVPFIELIKDFRKKPKDTKDMEFIQISWNITIDVELKIEPIFEGCGKHDNGNMLKFALELSPICELKDYFFKLNDSFEISQFDFTDKKERIIFESTKKFTLYEIISTILSELTFYGSPTTRNQT
ncbi:MAG TPA: hypothetical protein DCQ31_09910, partial [Bacteroidales bacterium]|nr:hypothetical protein [Bacteroidales bacterium]